MTDSDVRLLAAVFARASRHAAEGGATNDVFGPALERALDDLEVCPHDVEFRSAVIRVFLRRRTTPMRRRIGSVPFNCANVSAWFAGVAEALLSGEPVE